MNQILESLPFAVPIFFPVLCGLLILLLGERINRKSRCIIVAAALVLNLLFTVFAWTAETDSAVLFYLTKKVPVLFRASVCGLVTGWHFFF